MAIAIISYDIKYVQELTKNLGNTKYDIFGDSLSFIKNFRDDFDTVIYDASSGVFAEDDLRYLTNKMKDKNLNYIVLTVPENPIDKSIFQGNFEFLPKNADTNEVLQKIASKVEIPNINEEVKTKPYEEESKEADVYSEFKELEEFFHEVELKDSETTETPSLGLEYNDLFLEYEDTSKEKDYKEVHEDLSLLDNFNFEDLSGHKQEEKIIEMDYGILETTNLDISKDLEAEETYLNNLENLEEILGNSYIENENKDNKIEDIKAEDIPTKEATIYPKEELEQKPKTITLNEIMDSPKEVNEEKNIEGGKDMIANFNIQISSEDIKKMALEIAREYLKNDPAMATIIDHLQIDFQDEARREMEEIKNQLKNKVREEAEKVLTAEIEEIIKKELKDYVAEITAKIVKEKLEQAFRV
ncbi:hypothetical protein [Sulfurihydrogenibium azorense]|uniref:hypothetical protein n=1 Tax=Sulfurihydrogenibium azorense TaxID=309806 RepID=UPI00391CC207